MYRSVGAHAWYRHDLLAAEYKAVFGLKTSQSLFSSDVRQRLSEVIKSGLAAGVRFIPEGFRKLTPEQMQGFVDTRPYRMQATQERMSRNRRRRKSIEQLGSDWRRKRLRRDMSPEEFAAVEALYPPKPKKPERTASFRKVPGWKLPEEVREKMSAAHRARWAEIPEGERKRPAEWGEAISRSLRETWARKKAAS